MTGLWAVFAVMGLAAALLVAWPFFGRVRARERRPDPALEVYRSQLDEIARDLERGALAAEQAEAARTEIERRVLALADPAAAGERPRTGGRLIAGVSLAVCVPALATALYLFQGEPGAVPGAGPDADARGRVAEIAAALEKEPGDPRGWAALGEALSRLGDHEKAGMAFGHAARFDPENAAYPSLEGRALTLAAGGRVTSRALAAFEEALRRDPGDARASFYVGVAERRAGRPRAALERWRALLDRLRPDAPWAVFVAARAEALEAELAAGPDTPAGEARDAADGLRGPTREDVEAAAGLSAEDRAAMIRSMVDGLAERLETDSGNVAGWLRLARSRAVLGEADKAKAAWARAAALRPDDVGILVAWADGIVAAAAPAPPDPAEIDPVVERILALDGRNRRGLDLAGSLALVRGDRAAALKHWRALLDSLDPDDPAHGELRSRIGRLLSE